MVNLLSNELKVIANIRGIKGYESMSKDKLFSALIVFKNEDHDADLANINKTIREIQKENRDEDKVLRDLGFLFNPEKDHYEPKKTVSTFNNNYIEYESIGDKSKILTVREYLDMIRPYLSGVINNYKTQDELINIIKRKTNGKFS